MDTEGEETVLRIGLFEQLTHAAWGEVEAEAVDLMAFLAPADTQRRLERVHLRQ